MFGDRWWTNPKSVRLSTASQTVRLPARPSTQGRGGSTFHSVTLFMSIEPSHQSHISAAPSHANRPPPWIIVCEIDRMDRKHYSHAGLSKLLHPAVGRSDADGVVLTLVFIVAVLARREEEFWPSVLSALSGDGGKHRSLWATLSSAAPATCAWPPAPGTAISKHRRSHHGQHGHGSGGRYCCCSGECLSVSPTCSVVYV